MSQLTTVAYLRCRLSREKFEAALSWIKCQDRRRFLPTFGLWALDLDTTPDDPAYETIISDIAAEGWELVGEVALEVGQPLITEQLERLAITAVKASDRTRKG